MYKNDYTEYTMGVTRVFEYYVRILGDDQYVMGRTVCLHWIFNTCLQGGYFRNKFKSMIFSQLIYSVSHET